MAERFFAIVWVRLLTVDHPQSLHSARWDVVIGFEKMFGIIF